MKSPRFMRSCFLILISCIWGYWVSAEDSSHIILRGETLYSIARTSGVSVQELKSTNHLSDASKVKIGQKLIIPSKGNQKIPIVDQVEKQSIRRTYTVKRGDTLYSIARNADIAISILLSDNKIASSSVLKVGQELIVRSSGLDTNTNIASAQSALATPMPMDNINPTGVDSTNAASPVPSTDLSGAITSGTSFQKTAYTQGASLNWPHPGERFTLNGKLPGILIKAQKGEQVKSVNSGKVVYSGPHSTFGHIVFVQSTDGFIYIYGGNENSNLKTGETVRTGDIIGTVGVTPGIQEPQVYFSIWKDGSYINPALVLRS